MKRLLSILLLVMSLGYVHAQVDGFFTSPEYKAGIQEYHWCPKKFRIAIPDHHSLALI